MANLTPATILHAARHLAIAGAALALSGLLTGCVAVGYSSGGGWFIWPGSLGLLFLLLVVFFFLRRRR